MDKVELRASGIPSLVAAEHGITPCCIHYFQQSIKSDEEPGCVGELWDGGLLLKRRRGQADAIRQQSHRDLDEDLEVALRLDPETGWTVIGSAQDYKISRERAEILAVLRQSPRPLSAQEMLQAMGKDATKKERNKLYYLLFQMATNGQVYQPSYGIYSLSQ
jgi:hypothetical protein